MKKICFEIDSIPKDLFESSKDWSGLSITSLLARPLFYEDTDRRIKSDLIKNCSRNDELNWELELDDSACWSNGQPITANDIFSQIKRVHSSRSVSFPLVLHLKNIQVISAKKLKVTTKMPLAHLDRIFSNPALSPRHDNPGIFSGSWQIVRHESKKIAIQSSNKNILLELIEHEEGKDLYKKGEAEFSGPMTISPINWKHTAARKDSRTFDMDIIYALDIPEKFENRYHKINVAIDRSALTEATGGIVTPCELLCGTWYTDRSHSSRANETPSSSNTRPKENNSILYTSFTGNQEIANSIAKQLSSATGINFTPTPCPYTDFLDYSKVPDSFRIILLSSLWPHPASMLTPFRFSLQASKEFIKKYDQSLNVDNLDEALELAHQAEKELDLKNAGLIVLGRIKGCIRSSNPNAWYPPSGWMNVNNLIGR